MANSGDLAVSFGRQLHTKGGGEAVERLADEEIRLLENIKLHLNKRVKADLDYASTILRVNQLASRTCKEDSSPLAKAWTAFAGQSDEVAHRITENARHLSNTTLEALNKLIREKRNAQRKYASERRRIETVNSKLAGDVEKLKKNYRDYASETEVHKKKYEDLLQQQKKAKAKEIDKAREKYVKHATRLHHCHNDYILATVEANYQHQASLEKIMPHLLDAQQELQECYVEDWKAILQDYQEQTRFNRDDFVECFSSVQQAIDDVQKGLEYVTFVKQNSSDPTPFVPFEFDSQMMDLTTTSVQAGQIVLNNLTVESLRDKQETCQNKLEECVMTLGYRLEELDSVKSEQDDPDTESEIRRTNLTNRVQRQRDLEREIEELKCSETILKAQDELIKNVLEPLGEDDAPMFADNVQSAEVPQSLSPTTEVGLSSVDGGAKGEGNYSDLQRPGSKSVGHKLGARLKKLMGKSAKKDLQEEPVADSSATLQGNSKGDDSSDSYEQPPERAIQEEEWFHDKMGRKEAEALCARDGDYLVRTSGQRGYVLTTKWLLQPKHFIIQTDDEGCFLFEDKAFVTVAELLTHHVKTGTAVTKKSGVVIKKAILRKLQAGSKGLSHDSIVMGARLGKGNFGDVYRAKMKHSNQDVAVKTCRSENFGDAEKFLKEAQILAQYDHPNIVKLIGICSEKEPIYIVMELMLGGDFLSFLRKKGNGCSPKQLTEFGRQAAAGMEYLEGKNCIHRDLAARNCLIGDDNIVLKISDFGMSREEDDGIYTVSSGMKQIPIKWTAPEALNYGTYTSFCDVWSFGVLLWESFSCGSPPYPGINNRECRERVELGYRMPAPEGTPTEVYEVMLKCWEYEAESRPNFAAVHKMLRVIVTTMK